MDKLKSVSAETKKFKSCNSATASSPTKIVEKNLQDVNADENFMECDKNVQISDKISTSVIPIAVNQSVITSADNEPSSSLREYESPLQFMKSTVGER